MASPTKLRWGGEGSKVWEAQAITCLLLCSASSSKNTLELHLLCWDGQWNSHRLQIRHCKVE